MPDNTNLKRIHCTNWQNKNGSPQTKTSTLFCKNSSEINNSIEVIQLTTNKNKRSSYAQTK